MKYEEFLIEIGKRLTKYRERSGLTINSLKNYSGVDPKTIQRLESGFVCPINLLTLLKILDVYGISMSEFFKGLDCPDISAFQ